MRNVWQLIGVLLAVGFVGAYWRLIVLTVCAVVGVWLSICAYQGYRAWIAAERRHRQQLVARADEHTVGCWRATTEACSAHIRPRRSNGVPGAEWDAFMDDFHQTLAKFGVPERERGELDAIVESTKGIVKLFGNACGAVDVSGLGGER